jgi:hypothetical protein
VHIDAIKEELLFRGPFSVNKIDVDFFEIVKSFFGKQNVGTLYTDGASAMLCSTSSFAAFVKKEALHVIVDSVFSISACIGVKLKLNSVALVRKRNIPTERPPLSAK